MTVSSLETENITLTSSYSSNVAFNTYIYWKCVDRRFLIRRRNTAYTPATRKSSKCNWSKERSNMEI